MIALYLLDTDICIYLLNGRAPNAAQRLRELHRGEIATTAITAAELRYGALHSGSPDRNLDRVEAFLAPLVQIPFDAAAAIRFARIKQALAAKGQLIGTMDLLIAASAIAVGATLVTNNGREFCRVPFLDVVSWM